MDHVTDHPALPTQPVTETDRTRSGSAARSTPFVSIVVPTYREADNICELVTRIHDALAHAYPTYEILLVDDNSQDGIDGQVARLQEQRYPVRLIVRTETRGLSTAVMRGFAEALGDVLVCMDADLSHPPEKLPEMIASVESPDNDFVIGSRYVPGGSTDSQWGLFRWLNSRVATLLARPFSSARDPLAGYFAITRDTYQRSATLDPVGYKIGLEILVKARCRRVAEIPIHFADRKWGESKLSLSEQLRYLHHLQRLAEFKFAMLLQFIRFCLVGGTGMVVDLASYLLLLTMGMPMALARAAAIWTAMNWNFALNRDLTFRQYGMAGLGRSYWRFLCACSLGAVVSWTVSIGLPLCLTFFRQHLILAAAAGVVGGTLVNFQLSRAWAFRPVSDNR